MRIVVCDYAGHPFEVQLSRQLARRGHKVLHLYSADVVGPKGSVQRLPDDPDHFTVEGLTTGEPLNRSNLIRRRRQEAKMGDLLAERCRNLRPEVVIAANVPLDAQFKLMAAARSIGACFIFWLQDIISVAMEKILQKKSFLYRLPIAFYRLKEEKLLRNSDAVVAISEDFVPILDHWGVSRRKVDVIPNWAPLSEIPLRSKQNAWARKHGLTEARVVLYAGTLGFKHDPGKMVEVAAAAAGAPDVRVVVVSEGPGAEFVSTEARRRGLNNLIVLPFEPIAVLPEMLASAEVLVVLIEREAGIFSVPSKLLSYLCAGRAVLLSVPRENLAARIVEQNDLGIVVDPEDANGFVESALRLLNGPAEREQFGRRARAYADDTFDIDKITDRFEIVIGSALARIKSKHPARAAA